MLTALYAALNIPAGKLNVNAGVRYENSRMTVTGFTRIYETDTEDKTYAQANFFPSVNAAYNVNKEHLLRFGYGAAINRYEFREVSASVYYDFDLFSDIKGNPDLKPAYIRNFDLRYEFYPSPGELISAALFYKHFTNPIEWTYFDGGGSYTFSFENARSADNYGLELDVKKNLDFINAPFLSVTFNGALIDSKVKFEKQKLEHERQMQGQSPYIINAGLFYQSSGETMSIGILYNIIGKRIVGIGKVDLSSGGSINNDIPDMYEMPRNMLDITFRKKFGKRIELSAAIKDIIGQPLVYKQFPRFYDPNGVMQEREQITKYFNYGRNITAGVKIMIN
jgi:TonB-dependent receptor